MPQENQVLRCFSCGTFQVHIVKKAKKWECKICGAKQSFTRHYGKGSGKDCRNHVMKLNELRFTRANSAIMTEEDVAEGGPPPFEEVPFESEVTVEKKSASKWAQYLDAEDSDSENENVHQPVKRRKKSEGYDEPIRIYEEVDTDESAAKQSSKSKYQQDEEVKTGMKILKNIFDSDLDNTDNFLNFI